MKLWMRSMGYRGTVLGGFGGCHMGMHPPPLLPQESLQGSACVLLRYGLSRQVPKERVQYIRGAKTFYWWVLPPPYTRPAADSFHATRHSALPSPVPARRGSCSCCARRVGGFVAGQRPQHARVVSGVAQEDHSLRQAQRQR